MFLTAFVWGLGVSIGASIGMMVFVFMYAAFRKIVDSEAYEKAEQHAEFMKSAIIYRNELAQQANVHLAIIADAYLDCDEQEDEEDEDYESWRG